VRFVAGPMIVPWSSRSSAGGYALVQADTYAGWANFTEPAMTLMFHVTASPAPGPRTTSASCYGTAVSVPGCA